MGRGNVIALIVLAAIIIIFPFIVTNPYYVRIINFAGIYGLLCIGLSLLLGYAGQISIGQAGFFAIGAYASGILTAKFGYNVWFGILAGIALNSIVAFIVGVPTLKLRGHYLAMATLGIGEIIHIIAVADTEDFIKLAGWIGGILGYEPHRILQALAPYRGLTGGPSGFAQIPSIEIGAWELSMPSHWFYFIWGLVFVAMVLSLNLIHSRIGRALRAIHGNEEAAQAMGINTTRLKIGIFIISAGLASIAGSVYAHYVTFVSPDTFSINASIMFVVMVAVGGMMNVWGAVVGTVIMSVLPESLRMFHDYDILIYGLILLLIMMFMPNGVVGLMKSAVGRVIGEKTG
jgi:branched-chain amino acid transport system permease protein